MSARFSAPAAQVAAAFVALAIGPAVLAQSPPPASPPAPIPSATAPAAPAGPSAKPPAQHAPPKPVFLEIVGKPLATEPPDLFAPPPAPPAPAAPPAVSAAPAGPDTSGPPWWESRALWISAGVLIVGAAALALAVKPEADPRCGTAGPCVSRVP